MKRFWTEARAAGDCVMLDDRPLRAPGGEVLAFRSPRVAEAVAAEWAAVTGTVRREAMVLTQLATTASLRIAPDPAPVVAGLARYAESDLLCYRAEAPPALAARQEAAWQVWLDWAAMRFGARLAVTRGVMAVRQPEAAVEALRRALGAYDADALAALGVLVPALGSLVLGLAVAEGALTAEAAHETSLLDERFQEQLWGEDQEAAARRAAIRAELEAAARYLALTRQ